MKQQTKYMLGTAVAVLLVVVALIGANPMGSRLWRSIFPPGSKVHTASSEPVQIVLRDETGNAELRLTIPKAYLVDAQNWRGGVQEAVRIETQLPDLLPAPALPQVRGTPGTQEYEQSITQYRNGIAITLLGSRAVIDAGMPAHRGDIARANQSLTDSSRYELISSDTHGLEGYRQLRCATSKFPGSAFNGQEYCVDNLSEHYLPATSDSAFVHFICMRAKEEQFDVRMGCQGYGQFAGHQLNYVFRRSELSRWREFHDGVQRLLSQFQKSTN